ncbi:MAG: hypothetical protein M4D80_06115 [Myxococcota bacterium]|nr:hypothetical protein [Myxococcota bacterium]
MSSLLPSIASARSPVRLEPIVVDQKALYTIGAAVAGGISTGNLVIALYNPDPIHSIEVPVRVVADTIQYDWLTVEIKNASTSRVLRFIQPRERSTVQTARIQPRGLHFETIDLAPLTRDLPGGDYDVIVRWDEQVTTTTLSTHEPLRCGLAYYTPPKQDSSSSKLPYVLGGLAIASLFLGLVGLRLADRAGTAVERVPCSPS